MPAERHFLGWDAPVTAKMRDLLMPPALSGPVDLGKVLIIVPTAQAGRRLRETLALYCAERNTALLSPQVVEPIFFLRATDEPTNVASQTEVAATWSDVLMKIDISQYAGLFPARIPHQDLIWATHTAEMVQRLRDTLADGGRRITEVYRDFGSVLEEQDRWHDLAELETIYLERLNQLGLEDPYEHMIKRAECPELPEGVERVVVAAVPDPTPLMIRALEHLAKQVPIAILVHAPDSLADHFDNWGRPIADKWRESQIDIPEPEANVLLAGTPLSQSRKVLDVITEEAGRFGPSDIAIGVPDSGVIRFLSAELADKGLPTFDPAGKDVREHPLYHLLDAFRNVVNENTYAAFSSFLRHPDVLDFLQREHNLSPRWVLDDLDRFQNCHLPVSFEDISNHLPQERKGQEFANLEQALAFVQQQIDNFRNNDIDTAVRSLLQTLYQVRIVHPSHPQDREFKEVAQKVSSALRELVSDSVSALRMEKGHAMDLLLGRLANLSYYPERKDALIDLEGWLELPWSDAPLMIVTGMNDGSVPKSLSSDVFLPDSLRSQLHLRRDVDRLVTDAYLMRTLIESRKEEGRVCFIAGKTSVLGDPLMPSRLLFHCSDEQLPHRAERLFGDPDEKRDNYPSTVSFVLQPGPPPDLPKDRLDLQRLSVGAFRDYLACPFRFYLLHVLDMEELDDQKGEMDALDFGALIHHALQKMGESQEMRRCENTHELSNFLCTEAEKWITARFGTSPPLQVGIQLDAAKQRIKAAAQAQAELVHQGWEILHSEMKVEAELNGLLVKGQIDRVDRHRETGRLRILDYKTSDKAERPEDAHLRFVSQDTQDYAKVHVDGKRKRWVDLQLPLYVILLQGKNGFQGQIELGYFNLPKAVNNTGVALWEHFSDEVLQSAKTCAETIIENIRVRNFWPPAARVPYDSFEELFPAEVPRYIDVGVFEAALKEHKR